MARATGKKESSSGKQKALNPIIDKLEILNKEFSKANLHEGIACPVVGMMRKIAVNTDIDKNDKTAIFTIICEIAAELANEMQQPELSTELWQDRPMSNRNANPFQWVRDNFPSYGKGLHQGHIYNHDRPLYKRLHDAKPWPEDFDLPTLAEANDKYLKEAGTVPTLKEIGAASPPNIREMIRHLELSRARKRKKAK